MQHGFYSFSPYAIFNGYPGHILENQVVLIMRFDIVTPLLTCVGLTQSRNYRDFQEILKGGGGCGGGGNKYTEGGAKGV